MTDERMASGLPLVLKCPVGGEEWPATSYKARVDMSGKRITPMRVVFHCSMNHCFSLRNALDARMFTEKQGKKILDGARVATRNWQEARKGEGHE
ncbi:hypothetical protein LCGC14_1414820 [marine sediment metagenome]|uniref:Uncharacterized protein n=1 Tax=marine sediment metagenome TaxID=412755 RepID=A0A0F9JTI0_9ZZZZ